ncbi:uncharacterized protein DKFZp434B061-like isoform X9 [Accipiter gentilis]|uniref:uncharacterized protein DKFZp434B061-like isoform X7 n=1 Tax=Astur gentilis TaxID=8957 RepID=UPI00210F3A69|nr:uncharacterized protein DKFZp434B061-like isoform X7 [Accipiter gentilis]XP_049653516.1 uncharacterized protein DKFZp434B061-like isoform X8 [Accipiter gentilis]XP_049653518.1 uncharacterized protein DKFZp434B061-like isoform X9 [Accipiter gentilis]
MDPAVLLGAFPGTRRPTAQPRHGARSTRERGHKGDFFQREDRVIKSQDHDLLFSFMKRWSRLWVALTRILELQKLSSPGSTQDSSQASSQNVLTSEFGTGDPSYLPQTPPGSSVLRDRPKTPPRRHPRIFLPLRSGPEIPATCPRLLQEALFSGIDPRLLPGVIPERFDICVRDRRSHLPAPDSSKKLSSPGSTQDSSQASSQNVLTSAFGTGDPIYLPQTPPRSSLLRDRPKTPPRRHPRTFLPLRSGPEIPATCPRLLQEALFSGIDPRLLPGVIPERFDICIRDRRSQLPAPDSSKKFSSPGSTQDSSQASSQNVLTSAFGTGDPIYLPQTPPRSSLLRDRPKTPPRRHPRTFLPLRSGPEIPATCPRLLQEALFSGIDPRLLPGVIPERFDICVRDRRSHLPAPDSSKKFSSPGSTQDSSQASSQNVLTSAFGTGDPIYLPQTPPRSSLLRDRPKTPPRRHPRTF